MKKMLLLIFTVLLFVNCNEDDLSQNGCVSNLLPNYGFDAEINLNLPLYSGLQFAGNSAYVSGYGVKGIYLYNTGSSIVAFEASDPAHGPSACSRMSISGIEVTCECGDGNSYQLLTGQQTHGDTGNCLRAYRAEQNGSIVHIYN
jgi:nitrite reductase/ring-hydroxylating ferredoxin subunit